MSSEQEEITSSHPDATVPEGPSEEPQVGLVKDLANAEVVHEDDGGEVTPKPSRELQSILALSKEARLDTNISHKRKSAEPAKLEKAEAVSRRRSSTSSNEGQRADRKPVKVYYGPKRLKEEHQADDDKETKDKGGKNKRKRDSLAEVGIGGAADGKRNRKLSSNNSIIIMNNKKKDPFCWRCHGEGVAVFCETCPRSFHQKCLKQGVSQLNHWICPECVTILKAENLKQRSPAMRDMSLDDLCGLLKFALRRMLQVAGCEPFIHPVNENEFPEYMTYIVQPMNLTSLEKNIKDNIYGSPQAFEADAKWIVHNSVIFNSYQSKLTSIAKSILKICKQEMTEIENCANCYLNANTKKKTWFVEVCPKPHLLVWAKLKGFPYWPAKAMRANSQGLVDVRFFGAHDRAWIPSKECFLYSLKDPNSTKVKRNDINESIKELNVHIENLKKTYGDFRYAPYKLVFEPEDELKFLQSMLPRYNPDTRNNLKLIKRHSSRSSFEASDADESRKWEDDDESRKSNDKHSSEMGADEEDLESSKTAEDLKMIIGIAPTQNNKSDDESTSNEQEESLDSNDVPNCMSSPSMRVGKVRMRGGFTNTSGKIKIIPKLVSPDVASKRSSDEDTENSNNVSKFSDDEAKNDSGHLSPLSDKISKVDISENMEISMANTTNGSLSISETISPQKDDDFSKLVESKRKPIVQVNISGNENAEFTISPHSKSKIADKLMKKLSETDEVSLTRLESMKKQLKDPLDISEEVAKENVEDLLKIKHKDLTVIEKITELSPDMEIFESDSEVDKHKNNSSNSSMEEDTENENGSKDKSSDSVKKSSGETNPANELQDSTADNLSKNLEENNDGSDKSKELSIIDDLNNAKESSHVNNSNQNGFIEHEVLNSSEKEKNSNSSDMLKVPDLVKNAEEKQMKTNSSNNKEKDLICDSQVSSSKQEASESRKRKRSSDKSDENDALSQPAKVAKVDGNKESTPQTDKSILENRLNEKMTQDNAVEVLTSVVVKSEPSSDDEPSDNEYMELKRKYLSALDLNESEKAADKARQAAEDAAKDKDGFKVTDNISKVIDDVASHYSEKHANEDIPVRATPPTKKKEIFVKPLAKMQTTKQQRARKSFPSAPVVRNVYPVKKDIIKISKSLTTPSSVLKTSNAFAKRSAGSNFMFITPSPTSSSVTILPPNQPITYSTNTVNPVLTMVQQTASVTLPNDANESQNYIPQSGSSSILKTPAVSKVASTITTTTTSVNSSVSSTASTSSAVSAPSGPPALTPTGPPLPPLVETTRTELDELQTLSSFVPESVSKAISDVLCRAPPKLKPRPPGPLSTHFDEGLPSTAGPVTSKVNSVSHRLGDYFRGMLIELLYDMGSINPEAEIARLRLENEELKHKHVEEIAEIKRNINSLLKDVQKSIIEEKNRIVGETRSACEAECLKRVEEAKSKQWCANCSKEAQFYCCWNTSYCDYPCQQKHWPKHMSKCTQNIQNSQQLQNVAGSSTKGPTQPLVLRPTAPPKGFTTKTLLAKPTKVFVNRTSNKNSFNVVRTSSGSHITLVEATPGNYELLGNGGPISIGGKLITSMGKIKSANVISVTSPSSASATVVSSSGQKNVSASKSAPQTPKSTTSALVSDDED